MGRNEYIDNILDEVKKILKEKPDDKPTQEELIQNPDTIMNIINKRKSVDGILQEYQQIKQNKGKIAEKSIGKTKKTKKSKTRRALDIAVATIIISASVAALISAGVFIERFMVRPIADRFKFEEDLKASLEIVTTDVKHNLEHLNLGYTGKNGVFILYDNEVSDYASLGLSDPKPAEIRAYMEVIEGNEEKADFIKSVYYTDNDIERTYTDFNQYCRINGFTDPTIGTPSSIVFDNITEAQLVDAYNNGTINQIVHDLTKTQGKGGK